MTYVFRSGDTLEKVAKKYNTTVDRIVTINKISDRTADLTGRIIVISNTGTISNPPLQSNWCPYLDLGSRGNAVRDLQSLLRRNGVVFEDVPGAFGTRTRAAVLEFQRRRGLTTTGVSDRDTWQALGVYCRVPGVTVCPTLRRGNRGSSVRFLQSLLYRQGYYRGRIDGVFDSETERAVREFQANNNISPTGVVTTSTWRKLGASCVPSFPDGGINIYPPDEGITILPPIEVPPSNGPIDPAPELNYVWKEIDGFRYILATNEKNYYPGQKVKITFRKRNIQDKTVRLKYPSGQLFDFYISNEKGNEIWRWSDTQYFTQAKREITLPPGKEETVEIVWDQTNKRGRLVNPQTLTLWGTNKGTKETIAIKFTISERFFQG